MLGPGTLTLNRIVRCAANLDLDRLALCVCVHIYQVRELSGVGDPAYCATHAATDCLDLADSKWSQRGKPTIVLELGEMKSVMAAMNNCMANLVEHWGFDVEEQRTVQSPPTVTNLNRVTRRIVDYYPHDALRKGAQADFHLRLTVGSDGLIKSCTLLNQTLAPDFDMERHPCTAFERIGEFEPALTANGNPVDSYYTVRIRYVMPE